MRKIGELATLKLFRSESNHKNFGDFMLVFWRILANLPSLSFLVSKFARIHQAFSLKP